MDSISASQAQCYLGCPLQYKFRYVDKIPRPWRAAGMAFGASVHSAVEWFHRERIAGRHPLESAVVSIFLSDWYAQTMEPIVFVKEESKEQLADKGAQMVEVYVKESRHTAVPLAVEERFSVGLVDVESWEELGVSLHGVIDLIEADGTVVDLKTSARSMDVGGLERHLQLSIYALAKYVLNGQMPKLRLDVLLKTKIARFERYDTSRAMSDLSWTAQLLASVVSAIEAEQFFPNPSWRCAECEYFGHCGMWRGM